MTFQRSTDGRTPGTAGTPGPDKRDTDDRGPDPAGPGAVTLDASRADASGADASRGDASRADVSRVDASRADVSRGDASRADVSRADASRADVSRADGSNRDADRLGAHGGGTRLSRTRGPSPRPAEPPAATPGSAGGSEKPPLPVGRALLGLAGCVLRTAMLLLQRRIHLPRGNAGRQLAFADGSRAVVYRETTVDRGRTRDPAVLVVGFRLRLLQGRAHRWFRVESIFNTPLFVGFPGYVSKLWLTHDENGCYRGIYEWDGARAAETYARTLWRVLALGSVAGSIHYRVLPGVRRDEFLHNPGAPAAGSSAPAEPSRPVPSTWPGPLAPAEWAAAPAPRGKHRAEPAAGPAPVSAPRRTADPRPAGPADWWRPAQPISAKHRVPEPR